MNDKKFLQIALDQARKSVELGGFSAEAVIVTLHALKRMASSKGEVTFMRSMSKIIEK